MLNQEKNYFKVDKKKNDLNNVDTKNVELNNVDLFDI